MTTALKPVASAKTVAELMELDVDENVLATFAEAPEASTRRINVWHPGFSLMEQLKLPIVSERKLLYVREDLQTRDFAAAKPQAGYHSVCLPAPYMEHRTFAEQESIVAPFEETACPVAIATWTWLVHKIATGESLGNGLWMRCAESTSPGFRVALRAHAVDVFVRGVGWDDYRSAYVRLASLGE